MPTDLTFLEHLDLAVTMLQEATDYLPNANPNKARNLILEALGHLEDIELLHGVK